ncbi:MAG: S8 family peptidase [Pseudomonadota bacterium]
MRCAREGEPRPERTVMAMGDSVESAARRGGRIAAFSCAIGLFALISACSSSGGGGTPTITTPAPAPVTTPQPSASISANSAEYQANLAYNVINALPAYEAGIFGDGVLVAIVDTGINENNPEFSGRIDPRSADLVIASVVGAANARVGGPDLTDDDDHGTPIAALIGAARNGLGMHGVAPEADLLIYRTDDDSNDDLSIFGEALEEGIRRSAANGAKVLNLSLGSSFASARSEFAEYFEIAADGDIVTVIAAGNDGLDDPDPSAQAANDARAAGTVIVAGSVPLNDQTQLSDFSHKAGNTRDFFLVAPGERLRVPANNNSPSIGGETFNGTSASTPLIVGAAALVREVWPALTAAEVVEILLDSATDLGAPGTDEIFGRGLLNIEAALQPSGQLSTSSINGSSVAIAAGGGLSAPAFGAAALDFGEIVALDRYNRDFTVILSDTVAWTENLAVDPLTVIQPNRAVERSAATIAGTNVRFSLANETYTDQNAETLLRAPVFGGDRDQETILRFTATRPIGQDIVLSFAQGLSPRAVDGMTDDAWTPGSIARDGFNDPFLGQGEAGVATRVELKIAGLDVDMLTATSDVRTSYLDEALFDLPGVLENSRINNARLGVSFGDETRRFTVHSGVRQEAGAVLGARFGGALGSVAESTTYYQAIGADIALFQGWRLNARGALGVSSIIMNGEAASLGGVMEGLTSSQFAAGVYRNSVLRDGDVLSVSLMQPLRVESGDYVFEGAIAYDPFAEQLAFAEQRVDLSGAAREFDLEARYQLYRFGGGYLEAGVLHQFNALGGVGDATTGILRAGGAF